jgi:antiviral helicase SKI2
MEIQLTAEEESFLEIDRFALVNTVYEWARGRSFKDIMEYANDADESEGTIVRVITFLDEICNQVKNAALITGDSALHSKMTDAQEKIKRDIVFCASLYL